MTKKLENIKKENAEEKCKKKNIIQEVKDVEEKLIAAQGKTKGLMKELEDLKQKNKGSTDKENIVEK